LIKTILDKIYQLTGGRMIGVLSRLMNSGGVIKANLLMAWIWILMGFGSGMVMGLKFRNPDWLGGYTSHKRRLYRLGHISFFGLGLVNFLFAFTFPPASITNAIQAASVLFIIGAITMPICCGVVAHRPALHLSFSVPVVALLCGAVLTIMQIFLL
jgi:hypothetical protein